MAASAAAATPYAVAAVVWPPSQHLNQPVGLSTCLSLHYKPSLNGLTVFMWIFAVSFMHVTFFSPLTAALFWFSSPFLPSPRSTFPWVCFSTFRLLVLDINCSGRCTVAGFEHGWALSARAKKKCWRGRVSVCYLGCKVSRAPVQLGTDCSGHLLYFRNFSSSVWVWEASRCGLWVIQLLCQYDGLVKESVSVFFKALCLCSVWLM